MERIGLKQEIPLRQKISISSPLIVLGIIFLNESVLVGCLVILFGLLVFSINYALVIPKSFSNYYLIRSFNIPLFKVKKTLFFPDYISLFHQSFRQSNNVGFRPNILSDSSYKLYTIKLFQEHKNKIIFTSTNKADVLNYGQDLAQLLGVELYNTLE
ncbi:hypothetical protein [Psychroserpens sp. SPM9]|uniref:hypothetical protein n=1 Tax=Psychroserpens sp. SPM9 TaxID=2975598 RepID=UPI0021A550FA|nr:hypothetical protein [Psychroserpens sp. SPM9]MDG5491077.1 hypothetical protein [Psychroserpens sp. SPM9]